MRPALLLNPHQPPSPAPLPPTHTLPPSGRSGGEGPGDLRLLLGLFGHWRDAGGGRGCPSCEGRKGRDDPGCLPFLPLARCRWGWGVPVGRAGVTLAASVGVVFVFVFVDMAEEELAAWLAVCFHWGMVGRWGVASRKETAKTHCAAASCQPPATAALRPPFGSALAVHSTALACTHVRRAPGRWPPAPPLA